MLRIFNFKAIVIGAIVDIGCTTIFSVIVGIIAGIIYPAKTKGISNFENDYFSNIPLMVLSLFIGLLFTLLGGFVAARIAEENKKVNAIAVGIVSIFVGIFFMGSLPNWYNTLSLILIIPFAYFGGIIAISRKKV